jgi:hypothetical protein
MADRLPTPDEVHAYLLATGWREVQRVSHCDERWREYVLGTIVIDVPQWYEAADYGRRLREALVLVGREEGRPTPEQQVMRAIVERGEERGGP